MCEVLDEVENRGIAKGIEKGIAKGIKKGKEIRKNQRKFKIREIKDQMLMMLGRNV